MDNDGLLNGSDPDVDGGVARSGPLRARYIGDRLVNSDPNELDIDDDRLAAAGFVISVVKVSHALLGRLFTAPLGNAKELSNFGQPHKHSLNESLHSL